LEIRGSALVHALPATVSRALDEPACLRRSIPGCETLVGGEDLYRIEVSIGVAAVRGRYEGEVRILRHEAGECFDFHLGLTSARGFVDATVRTTLSAEADGTRVSYVAESELGGPLAALGQRIAGGVATLLVRQFCEGLGREAEAMDKG